MEGRRNFIMKNALNVKELSLCIYTIVYTNNLKHPTDIFNILQ